MAEEVKEEKQEPKRKKEPEAPAPVPMAPEVETPIKITSTQFMRSEQLGHLRAGFAIYMKEQGLGGFKTRKEWTEIFHIYRNTPIPPFQR